jgi:PST family polysaccharide transporter
MLKATAFGGGATAVTVVLAMMRNKLCAVALGPEGVGAFAQINVFLSFANTFVALGLGVGLAKVVAESRIRGDLALLRGSIGAACLLSAAVAAATVLVTFFVAPWISRYALNDAQSAPLFQLAALALPASVLGALLTSVLQGQKEIGRQSSARVWSGLLTTALLFALLVPCGIMGWVAATVIGSWLALLIVGRHSFHAMRAAGLDASGHWWQWVRGLAAEAKVGHLQPLLVVGLSSVCVGLLATASEFFIRSAIVRHLGEEKNGLFQAGNAFSLQYMGLALGALSLYSFPRFSEIAGDAQSVAREINQTLRFIVLFVTPCICVLLMGNRWLVPLLFSARFQETQQLLPLFLFRDFAQAVASALWVCLLPLNRIRFWLAASVGVHVLLLGSFLVMFRQLGMSAAIWNGIIGWSLAAAVIYLYLHRTLRLRLAFANFKLLVCSAALIVGVHLLSLKPAGWVAASASLAAVWALLVVKKREWQAALDVARRRFGLAQSAPLPP